MNGRRSLKIPIRCRVFSKSMWIYCCYGAGLTSKGMPVGSCCCSAVRVLVVERMRVEVVTLPRGWMAEDSAVSVMLVG